MTSLKVVEWNCGGLSTSTKSTPLKMGAFDKNFPNSSFDIAALVETHHKEGQEFPELIEILKITHNCIHTPAFKEDPFAGIIVLIAKHLNISSTEILFPGRLINFKIENQSKEEKYNFFVFYGQTRLYLNKARVIENIKCMSEKTTWEEKNIIIGDFNFCSHDCDRHRDFYCYDKLWDKPWQNFCSELDLVDPFRIQYPRKKVYSYVSTTGKSRIDRAYVSQEIAQRIVDMKYTRTIEESQAHKIFSFKINHPQPRGSGFWKLNSSILRDNAYVKLVEETAIKVTDTNPKDPQLWWVIFLKVIRSKTISYCRKKRYVETCTKKYLQEQLDYLESFPTKLLTPTQAKAYIHLKARFKEFELKEIEGHQIRTKIIPTFEIKAPNISFFQNLEKRAAKKSLITGLRNEEGIVETDTKDLLETTYKYYTKLFTNMHTDTREQDRLLRNIKDTLTHTQRTEMDMDITEDEIVFALRNMKLGKAPGVDDISFRRCRRLRYITKD